MGGVLGLLFAAVPLIAWGKMARTPGVGSAVGAALLVCACLLIAVQHGRVFAYKAEAHALYAVFAALLIAFGRKLERDREAPGTAEGSRRWNWAVGLLRLHLAFTVCGCLLYALLQTEASMPSSRDIPPLPAGLTVLSRGGHCGSSSCAHLLKIGSTTGLSRDEILRKLNRPHETCRPNGWLLDRRDLCIGVQEVSNQYGTVDDPGDHVRLYVSLSGLLD
ncbi:MFS transporter [Streptomyces sp. NPDC002018]|uniref:MFS transporter n=1 Tax=Streptomyces sp. NPDC002018 TaxID=3364629 RepID=UPI0036B4E309